MEIVEVQEYVGDPAYGTATTQLHKVHTRILTVVNDFCVRLLRVCRF